MDFGQRFHFQPVRDILQIDRVSDELRNRIWSEIYSNFLKPYVINDQEAERLSYLVEDIWSNFCKKPLDEMKHIKIQSFRLENINSIKQYIFNSEWFKIYEFLEFTVRHDFTNLPYNQHYYQKLLNNLSNILVQESSAYRLSNKELIRVTEEQEIQSIEEALANTNPYSGVQQHLKRALELMSDRQNPDYRNSIKESVSALEGLCQKILNKDKVTLGDAIGQIEKQFPIHSALKNSIKSLYGYTSDGDGIRHAMLEEPNLTYIDAKFMLVACTNFINYLIDKTKD